MQLTSLLLMVLFTTTIAAEAEQSVDEQIQEALLPLPESLRAGRPSYWRANPGSAQYLDQEIVELSVVPIRRRLVVIFQSCAITAALTRSSLGQSS